MSGIVDAIVVSAYLDYGNLQYNAKFLTDEELDRYINDPDVNVHDDIIADDEGVVAVERPRN